VLEGMMMRMMMVMILLMLMGMRLGDLIGREIFTAVCRYRRKQNTTERRKWT
jgi:hypothetical protein